MSGPGLSAINTPREALVAFAAALHSGDPRKLLRTIKAPAEDNEFARAYAELTVELLALLADFRRVFGSDPPAGLRARIWPAPTADEAAVAAIAEEGGAAEATLPDGRTLALVREAGRWVVEWPDQPTRGRGESAHAMRAKAGTLAGFREILANDAIIAATGKETRRGILSALRHLLPAAPGPAPEPAAQPIQQEAREAPPEPHHTREALEFHCDATIEALRERLNELGPWTWMLRDSHWYGDYLYTAPASHVRVRVLEPMDRAGPPYTIQIDHKRGRGLSLTSVRETVADLLARLGAEGVRDAEPPWD